MNVCGYALCLLASATLATSTLADTVDDFTLPMGPITVGPGEEVSEEEGTMFAPGTLGGFRVLAPVVDEEAPADDRATTSIGDGVFECDLSATSFGGGCTVGWAPDETGASFDFTGAGAVEFEILEAGVGAIVAVLLINGSVDINDVLSGAENNGAIAYLENPGPGVYSLPIAQFLNFNNPGAPFDFGSVTVVALTVAFEESFNGIVRIGAVSTTGPVGDGPEVEPPDDPDFDPPPDEELLPFVSGTYYNPARDGEGCQLTLEGDGVTLILSCYLFQDGAQAWVIGSGTLVDGVARFEVILTSGADFGDDFDADDVERTPWGTAIVRWRNCNDTRIELVTLLEDYPPFTLETTKVTRSDCTGTGPSEAALLNQGTLYDPVRDGEGFQIAAQGESNVYVLTWYTYFDGAQVWLVGSGTRTGDQLVFADLIITSGADYGADFDAGDVVRTPWGTIIFEFTDCNNAVALINPLEGQPGQPAFDQFEIPVRKLVLGTCP